MLEEHRKYLETIRVENLRICRFPSLVFLCGGSLQTGSCSARKSFLDHTRGMDPMLATHFILAEHISGWFEDGDYRDLLSFEKDLARLSSLTILFVESPGSIAELGAFSLLDPINTKIFAILQEGRSDEISFINLGPIKYIKNMSENAIHYYPWSNGESLAEEHAKDLVGRIREQIDSEPKERQFVRKDVGHIMLLLADIVRTLLITKRSELVECLRHLELDLCDSDVKRYLYVLDKLGIYAYPVASIDHNIWGLELNCRPTSFRPSLGIKARGVSAVARELIGALSSRNRPHSSPRGHQGAKLVTRFSAAHIPQPNILWHVEATG